MSAIVRTAVLGGPGNCYRYELRRVWDDSLPMLVVCMLNPSNADAERDDPTILALIWFARLWGHGGLLIVNLFAFRASRPTTLVAMHAKGGAVHGAGNGKHIESALAYAAENGGKVLAAWGNGGSLDGMDDWFVSRARSAHRLDVLCLGTTKLQMPKHPMARGKHRIPRDQQPIIWRRAN
ncbi:DUF1643 domain-containing protein [Sphingomonas sp. AR_OL41]|uniref:DUF1643 domain-containing protein n=1 Tax=Sphingomonas sp. AR_OL41 TaxID=3042729 RepID=UPI00248177C5|nr:DUF1643 domain-containing protein [Sphingomonas sp. AR_OL41]MDH7971771.1 DUF1643 domain-containing protein [Sphingomonas sp. AR_OL41]